MATKYRGRWRVRWQEKQWIGGELIQSERNKMFPLGTPLDVVRKFELEKRLERIDGIEKRSIPFLSDYSKRFLAIYPTIKRRGAATLKKDRSSLKHYILPAFGHLELDRIGAPEILDFQAELHADGDGLAPQSCSNVLSTLSSIYRLAVLERHCQYNPCAAVPRIPRGEDAPWDYWTPKEANRFLLYCRERDFDLFQLCAFTLNTGLRPGELQGLLRDAINFEEGFVHVHRNWCTKTQQLVNRTKNGLPRKVALSPQILQLMDGKRRLAPTAPVFPLKFNSLGWRFIRPMAIDAGVKPIRFHDLRHTFATHLVLHGRHPVEIKELLGHKKLSSTDRYMHVLDELKRGATDCLVEGMVWAQSEATNLVNLDTARLCTSAGTKRRRRKSVAQEEAKKLNPDNALRLAGAH